MIPDDLAAAMPFHPRVVRVVLFRGTFHLHGVDGDDLINLGVGGACLCEPAFGEYIGARPDWDVATLALSVNMIARGFTIEEFTQRTTYLVQQVVARNPA